MLNVHHDITYLSLHVSVSLTQTKILAGNFLECITEVIYDLSSIVCSLLDIYLRYFVLMCIKKH
jgi:hypothetical protein